MVKTWMVSQKLLRKTGSRGWMEESKIVGTLSARTKPITARTEPATANCRFLKMSSKIEGEDRHAESDPDERLVHVGNRRAPGDETPQGEAVGA